MSWQFVIVNPDGSAVGEVTAARNRKALWKLDDSCSASYSIDGTHPQAAFATELQSDLVIYGYGKKRFRGRMGASADNLDGTVHGSDFTAVDYRGLLARRYLWPTTTLSTGGLAFGTVFVITSKDQADIAWSLIDGTQTTVPQQDPTNIISSSFNISAGSVPRDGILRDRTYYVGDNIGTLLDDLGRVLFGFNWEIDAELAFNLYPFPGRGAASGEVLAYGTTVSKVTRTVDTSTFANASMETSGQGGSYVPGIAEVNTSQFAPAGRWEFAESGTSITDHNSALAKAQGNLAATGVVSPTYALTLKPGWWNPDLLWLGDTARVVIQSGRLNIDTTGRISQVEVDIDDSGSETVILTVGPFKPGLDDIVRQSATRLDRLYTR